MICHCSLAGTSACRSCSNNPNADRPPVVRTNTVITTDKVLITNNGGRGVRTGYGLDSEEVEE